MQQLSPPITRRAGDPPIREQNLSTNQQAGPEGDAGGGTNILRLDHSPSPAIILSFLTPRDFICTC